MVKIFVDGGSEQFKIPKPSSSFDVKSLMNICGKKPSKPSYTQQLYITRRKGEMHSLWCEALYRLSLANHVSMKCIPTFMGKEKMKSLERIYLHSLIPWHFFGLDVRVFLRAQHQQTFRMRI